MSEQSTNHLLMIEPGAFYANPQTMETNVYQLEDEAEDHGVILKRALQEFRTFRDKLVENGVNITTALGHKDCPDMVFPNWVATYAGGKMMLCPMLNENRRAERTPEVIALLQKMYPEVIDWTLHEDEGLYLESTGSICSDHVNKIAYAGLSKRTSREMAEKWAQMMGYEIEIFDTQSDPGGDSAKPVYHTDLLMYIGTGMAAICPPCIVESDRARVVDRIKSTHEVIELSMEQLQAFCGNALEVRGEHDVKILAISSAAYEALTEDQLGVIGKHFERVVHSPLPTLEKYGGGSARCTLLELF